MRAPCNVHSVQVVPHAAMRDATDFLNHKTNQRKSEKNEARKSSFRSLQATNKLKLKPPCSSPSWYKVSATHWLGMRPSTNSSLLFSPSLKIIGADLSAEVIVAPGKPFHCSLLQAHSFPRARGGFRCEANTSPLSTAGPAPGTAATAPREGPAVNLQKSNQEKKRYHRRASPHPHIHRELAPRKQNRQKPFPTRDHPAHQKKRCKTAKTLPAVSHPVRSSCSEAPRSGE